MPLTLRSAPIVGQPLSSTASREQRAARPPRLLQAVACTYAVLLSYLLLAPDPLFFLGSTGSQLDAAVTRSVADWVEHAAVYLVFTGLVLIAWPGGLSPLLFVMVHAVATECIQHWIPFREASFRDLLANGCGVAAGVVLVRLLTLLGVVSVDRFQSGPPPVR